MAKTTAPLLGFGASGTVADTIVYATWRGVPYARRHVIPGNPNSLAQQDTRNIFRTLSQMWKSLPAAAVAPWNAFATGRPFLGSNQFTGQNMRVLRKPTTQTDMDLFIGSPGARGGLAPTGLTLTPGSSSITVELGIPTPPVGWSITAAHAIAFLNQNPTTDFGSTIEYATDPGAPYEPEFTGLTPSDEYVVSAWIEYARPDTQTAYSVSLTDVATPTA